MAVRSGNESGAELKPPILGQWLCAGDLGVGRGGGWELGALKRRGAGVGATLWGPQHLMGVGMHLVGLPGAAKTEPHQPCLGPCPSGGLLPPWDVRSERITLQ